MSDTSITIVGNLADDPREHLTSSGVAIASFRVGASQRRFDKAQDRWVDGPTSWYRVSAFRGLAVNVLASLRKGQRVVVTGRLRLHEWDTGSKQGVTAEIDADAVGHDLLWGTSSFSRAASPRNSTGDGSEAAIADGGGADDAWAAPGSSWETPDAGGGDALDARDGSSASVDEAVLV